MLCAELNQSFGSPDRTFRWPLTTAIVRALNSSTDAMPIRNTFIVPLLFRRGPRKPLAKSPRAVEGRRNNGTGASCRSDAGDPAPCERRPVPARRARRAHCRIRRGALRLGHAASGCVYSMRPLARRRYFLYFELDRITGWLERELLAIEIEQHLKRRIEFGHA